MLNFFGQNRRDEPKGWSDPDERTVINNVACILPPNLSQDVVHNLLLRFQLEENKHYLQNLTDETKYVKYYDELDDASETKPKFPPDARIRNKLVQERSKIIESIRNVYPPYIYLNDNYAPSLECCEEIKEMYLNTSDQFTTIIGDDGKNIKKIEQQFDVNITITDVPISMKNSPNSIYKDSLYRLLIKGNSKENISECFQHIQNIIKSRDSIDLMQTQKPNDTNENYSMEPAPWKINNSIELQSKEEEEESNEKGLYDLNSLLKNKEDGYMSLINKQGPPGS